MAKKKFPYILIKDAKNGFRTQLVGGNGEPLMTSEVLESAKAVQKNLIACRMTGISKISQSAFSVQEVSGWINEQNVIYTGKSEAIYKMFNIEKGGAK